MHEGRVEKEKARDELVRRVLLKKSRTLCSALGLPERTPEAEVRKRSRNMLRLLHPDFPINQQLKGTPQHARVEAAFKKLNGLRDVVATVR